MSDKPTLPTLPQFPEGGGPRRRRTVWWKRAWRAVADVWNRLIGGCLDFFLTIFGGVWSSLDSYVRGRQLWRLLYALPAFLALAAAGVMAILLLQSSRFDFRPAYRHWAQQARDSRNFELARVCYLRLSRDEKPQQADLFGLLQALREVKQDDKADALLTSLTPLDGSGYSPAYVLQARRLLSDPKGATPVQVQLAERHLHLALKTRPDSPEVNALLGQLYFAKQNWKLAEQYLVKAEPAEPGLARLLMVSAAAQGNADGSKQWAKRSAEVGRQQLKADPNNVGARLGLAEALLAQKDLPGAAAIIQEGANLAPRPEYQQALSQIYTAQVREFAKDKAAPNASARWQLIQQGLREDPNNLYLLQQLLEVTHGQDAVAAAARQRLQELLAEGKSSAVLHLALGLDAFEQKKLDKARFHWERTFELEPRMLIAANNVAWLLAHPTTLDRKHSFAVFATLGSPATLLAEQDPEHLKRSLQLIETVVKQAPNNASFRETRGQILIILERWKDAVSDLEYALPLLTDKAPIHTSLALAYDKLGLPELAEPHRKLAKPAKP